MKILELFSGYGTASFALKRLVEQRIIDSYECIGYSDIDKYANQCFRQNHFNEVKHEGYSNLVSPKELGDVKLINPQELEDFDLLTGGFPCQAFSVAGKGLGELDPRGTLFYEIIRIAEVKKPRWMLLENVKGLTNKNHKPTFDKILSELARIGYKVHWKILNTKDYGVPQNRERVWFVCFREKSDYDKFKFPEKEELKIFIKDILEEQVNEKYFLSELLQERFRKYLEEKNCVLNPYNKKQSDKIVGTIGTSVGGATGKTAQVVAIRSYPRTEIEVHSLYPRSGDPKKGGTGHLFKNDGTSYAIDTGNCQAIKDNLVYDRKGFDSRTKGFRESELSPTLSTKMGTGGNNVPMVQDVANCLKIGGIVTKPKYYYEKKNDNFAVSEGRLRRLTPKECFRLQGFLNDEVNFNYTEYTNIYKVNGNIKLWKQQSAKSNAAKEKPTHTNMVITALCTTKDLNELELGKNKEEILRKIESVCIAIEKLEKVDAKECVIDITKCSDYTEMLYTLIKRKIGLREMDMFVELEEGQDTKSLWKISLGENLSKEKSFITSILINWIIQKKIYSYVKTESTIIANIMNYNLSEQNCLNLELSSLRMDTTKKLSDTALYKLAGNGQSVNVVEKIFKEMFK